MRPGTLKEKLKTISYRGFLLGDRLGVHVLPKHYYTPISDYRWLAKNLDAWTQPLPMTGIDWDLDCQLEWLTSTLDPYLAEVPDPSFASVFSTAGPGYGPIESQVLYAFIRSRRPKRVIEIGSGVSTQITLMASRKNLESTQEGTQITCIEPNPSRTLRASREVDLIPSIVQDVPTETFAQLNDGDLLFIDSSHTVKIGSDVNKILLEIVPSLQSGVYVHLHDIYLPYTYAPSVLHHYFGWQETAMLYALLMGNERLRAQC